MEKIWNWKMGNGSCASKPRKWTIRERDMLGKMNRCTASSACEAEKHMQNHHRKTGSSSV